MEEKINREYFEAETGAAAFNYNNVTGGADSASGGSGGSGMECLQLRSQPGPFHYLISEQAKSLVALQELQNEVGALLEFRDLVIETFPNLRSKMAPSTPASGTRRDWEPGVRVRRKLAGGGGDATRAKPQPSVQDSGFSTETSCGKDAHSSASASASASRPRPLEDELWALLDVIQRKGGRLRDEAELLRGELDERHSGNDTAEESFARALLTDGCNECGDVQRLRVERDALLARAAQLEALASSSPTPARTPLGRLDSALERPPHPPLVSTPDSKKFAAILLESNPVELQRQLLISTVQNQVLCERLKLAAAQRTIILEKLERARDVNEDLKFRLEEKSIEVEGARALVRQLEGKRRSPARSAERGARNSHSSMRDMEPLHIPDGDADDGDGDEEARISSTPRRTRPSRIPLHTAHKGAAPRPPAPPRPPSAHSTRSARSSASARSRSSRDVACGGAGAGGAAGAGAGAKSSVPVRRSPSSGDGKRFAQTNKETRSCDSGRFADSLRASEAAALVSEYVSRASRLAPLFPRVRSRPLPHDMRLAYATPQNLALELSKSILYEDADSIDLKSIGSLDAADDSLWNGKPQHYFESMNYGETAPSGDDALDADDYESDSLAP